MPLHRGVSSRRLLGNQNPLLEARQELASLIDVSVRSSSCKCPLAIRTAAPLHCESVRFRTLSSAGGFCVMNRTDLTRRRSLKAFTSLHKAGKRETSLWKEQSSTTRHQRTIPQRNVMRGRCEQLSQRHRHISVSVKRAFSALNPAVLAAR